MTLVELLAVVAALTILLGLMVSLARHVRRRSAERLTAQTLLVLDRLARQNPGLSEKLASRVTPLVVSGHEDDATIRKSAPENGRTLVLALKELVGENKLAELPVAVYDGTMLRDAWGTPIVVVPAGGSLPGGGVASRLAFVSAGPDRSFTGLSDNQLSYESVWLETVDRPNN